MISTRYDRSCSIKLEGGIMKRVYNVQANTDWRIDTAALAYSGKILSGDSYCHDRQGCQQIEGI